LNKLGIFYETEKESYKPCRFPNDRRQTLWVPNILSHY